LHNFLRDQPDLNWWEEGVHAEFDRILRYWFDRGVAGFRIDVAHGLYKDALLRDNPPVEPADHQAIKRLGLRPVYNANRPEVHDVYRHWRQIADSYAPGRALLGETWEFDFQRFGDYYGRGRPELHMAFNFLFVEARFNAPELASIVEGTLAALPPGATPVWTGSNHDVGRFPTRWCGDDDRAVRAALVVLATLPGSLVLYYGDELGMADVDVPVSQQVDQISLARPGGPSRDRGRTPMPWSREKNGGFTTASARPWLPLGHHGAINVDSEREDPGSVLNFWRQLSGLRKAGLAGNAGWVERMLLDEQVWAYRAGGVTTMANLSPGRVVRRLELGGTLTVLASTTPARRGTKVAGEVELGPWEAVVMSGAAATG
jgi:alpha-glucosidase